MTGLILKDLISLQKQYKSIGLVLLFYAVFVVLIGEITILSALLVLLCTVLPVNVFAYDEKAKWDKFALTTTVSRYDMVLSKYILAIFFITFGLIFSVIVQGIIAPGKWQEALTVSLGTAGAGIVMISILFPLLFKFGSEKGRLILMLILFFPVILMLLLEKLGFKEPNGDWIQWLPYIAPVIIIVLFIISILVSLNIYNKKEFQ